MTKRLSFLFLVLGLACPLRAADDAKAARETLDRAIKAMGGPKLLAKKALSGSSRGTVETLGMKSPVTNEFTVQGLDQMKWAMEVTLNGTPTPITIVMNRGKAWIKGNNADANELKKEPVTGMQQGLAGLRLAESLLPLTGKEWKLSSLGEVKFDDVAAVGIKASKKGLPEIDLYFNKTTFLPLRGEMRVTEQDGREIPYVAKFASYKKVEGRQYFTRLTVLREDKVVLEMERTDFKAKESVDEETFNKP